MKTIAHSLLIIFFLASCNVLDFSEGEIITDLKLESDEISNIQDIEATFIIRNGTDGAKTYSFNSGCQSAFKVLNERTVVFNSFQNVGCTAALTSLTLKKRESKTVAIPKYFDVELKPGTYTFKAFLIGYENEVSASKEFVVAN